MSINRATPKTQSALLEAMEERQVTGDERTYRLPEPFMVLATQNPIEYEGTFPLPEAQLDRFLMRISLGHPKPEDELRILEAQRLEHPLETLRQVVEVADLLRAQEQVRHVIRGSAVSQYIVSLVEAHTHLPRCVLGGQPARLYWRYIARPRHGRACRGAITWRPTSSRLWPR
jgi:MoxR-like ATPase